MKKSSVLVLSILIFLLSFVLFHFLGLYLFFKHFGLMGGVWFLSFLGLIYSILVIVWNCSEDNPVS